MAIHNINNRAGRVQAVREIARVIKPGGRVALLDIQSTGDYTQTLRELGWQEVTRSWFHFLIFRRCGL